MIYALPGIPGGAFLLKLAAIKKEPFSSFSNTFIFFAG
jgi:hypothetical protein